MKITAFQKPEVSTTSRLRSEVPVNLKNDWRAFILLYD